VDVIGPLLLVVATLLILLVSGNNTVACVGNLIGARVVSTSAALLMEVAGVSLGLIFQGTRMATAAEHLAKGLSSGVVLVVLTITLGLFVVGALHEATSFPDCHPACAARRCRPGL